MHNFICIDTDNILGEGEFGTVYKAAIRQQKVTFPAAAKVIKNIASESSDSFKMLLDEIKIAIYAGNHENVVKFFGVTSDASIKGG